MRRAGETLDGFNELLDKGLLAEQNNLYCLSDLGRKEFERISAELYLYETPGAAPLDFKRCAMTTELWLELERCNIQRWGLKRYLFRPELEVRPALNNNNYYLELAANKSLAEWLELDSELFTPDLILLINYDFKNYLGFKPLEHDKLKLANTDRFIFVIVNNININEELDVIKKFYKFIIEQRYLRLPNCFDLDCHEQGSATWLIFVTELQADAINLQRELKNFAFNFIELLRPAEIWTLPLESLRDCEVGREVIWEVLPELGLPVCRAF